MCCWEEIKLDAVVFAIAILVDLLLFIANKHKYAHIIAEIDIAKMYCIIRAMGVLALFIFIKRINCVQKILFCKFHLIGSFLYCKVFFKIQFKADFLSGKTMKNSIH